MSEQEFDVSRALDEIYNLRKALAYEAAILKAHLGYATFPKSRRGTAEASVERMQRSARGEVVQAYAGISYLSTSNALLDAGTSAQLTRWKWEAERA